MRYHGRTVAEAIGKACGRQPADAGSAFGADPFASDPFASDPLARDRGGPARRDLIDFFVQRYDWPSDKDRMLGIHYLRRRGTPVTLRTLGILADVKRHAERVSLGRFRAQVLDEARRVRSGPFSHRFENSYPFGEILHSLGWAKLSGVFHGEASMKRRGEQRVKGKATIEFLDIYEDPLNLDVKLRGYFSVFRNILGKPFVITDRWAIYVDRIE